MSKDKNGNCIYQGDINICESYPLYDRCCQSKKEQSRTINTDSNESLRQKMKEKMAQADSKEIYKQRKVIVEPVFGQIKNSAFRGFGRRGKDKAKGEFSLVCAAHNMKKIVEAIGVGSVCPEFGDEVADVA